MWCKFLRADLVMSTKFVAKIEMEGLTSEVANNPAIGQSSAKVADIKRWLSDESWPPPSWLKINNRMWIFFLEEKDIVSMKIT